MQQDDGQPDRVVSVHEDPRWPQRADRRAVGTAADAGRRPGHGTVSGRRIWTGGYWVWHGDWVWARGRWRHPPACGYAWHHPYYEHRVGAVIFVNGFWGAPGVSFIAPGAGLQFYDGSAARPVVAYLPAARPQRGFCAAAAGIARWHHRAAPLGVAPAVVLGAPPIVQPGMAIRANGTPHARARRCLPQWHGQHLCAASIDLQWPGGQQFGAGRCLAEPLSSDRYSRAQAPE